jgi:hypothetical protein
VLTCVPLFAAILRIPFSIIAPIILVICAVGAYTVHNSMFDVWMMMAFGVVGYVFQKLGYPLPPLVLAIVLGDKAEESFRQAMLGSQGSLTIFWSNWLVGTIMTLGMILLFWPLITWLLDKTRSKSVAIHGCGIRRRRGCRQGRAKESVTNNQNQQTTGGSNETKHKDGAGRARAHCRSCSARRADVAAVSAAQGWEPTKPVQFIIPAGTGGGADQMARFIQGVVAKNNLMKQAMITVNKGGGAGAEGFLEVQKSSGDAHTIIITLSNLFTTPYGTGVPFSWKDMTPVAMLALDQFVLWVNAETPYKTAKEYIDAVKAGDDKTFKMGGTGSKQEDQIITVALEKLTAPKKFTYVPYAGGGAVADPAGRQARQLDRQQSRSRRSRSGRPARCGRCASSTPSAASTRRRSRRHGLVRHPDLQGVGRRHRIPDAARHLHAAGRHARAGRLLRRPLQEGDGDRGLEEVHGGRRLQPDLHERRRVQELGRATDKLHYDLMKEAGFLAK